MCCRNVTQAAAGSCSFCRARLAAAHVVAFPGVSRDSSLSDGDSPPRPLQRHLTLWLRALARVAHSPERAVAHAEIDEDRVRLTALCGTGVPAPDDREHADGSACTTNARRRPDAPRPYGEGDSVPRQPRARAAFAAAVASQHTIGRRREAPGGADRRD